MTECRRVEYSGRVQGVGFRYTVLRLANDEVEQDYGKAIDKIRDLVRLRQRQAMKEE